MSENHFFRGYQAALKDEEPVFVHDAYKQIYYRDTGEELEHPAEEARDYLNGYDEGMKRVLERSKVRGCRYLERIAEALESSEPWPVSIFGKVEVEQLEV